MPFHPEREHGAAGNLECHALHRLAQIDRRAGRCMKLRDGLIGDRDHVRDQRRHRARRKGRRQCPALVFPGAAFGDQQAFAKHRAQHPEAGRRPRIILVIIDQHMPDRVRRVEDEAGAAEKPAPDNVVFVSPSPPSVDRALAHRPHPGEGGHAIGCARRARRHQRTRDRQVVGFGDAHMRSRIRSPDERSDIRGWWQSTPDVAALIRATPSYQL